MVYHPDTWVILKLTHNNNTIYKILAGWYGGYCGSDSWKLNSGITAVRENKHSYCFYGSSGSIYVGHESNERLSGVTSSIISQLEEKCKVSPDYKVELIKYADFIKEFVPTKELGNPVIKVFPDYCSSSLWNSDTGEMISYAELGLSDADSKRLTEWRFLWEDFNNLSILDELEETDKSHEIPFEIVIKWYYDGIDIVNQLNKNYPDYIFKYDVDDPKEEYNGNSDQG